MTVKNILIVGEEQSGKTTLVEKVIRGINHKIGFVSRERSSKSHGIERVEYYFVPIHNEDCLEGAEGIKMGYVDFNSNMDAEHCEADFSRLTQIVRGLNKTNGHFLFADEVTLMDGHVSNVEAYKLINGYLSSPNLFLATVTPQIASPSFDFVNNMLRREDSFVIELNPKNRKKVYEKVMSMIPARYY